MPRYNAILLPSNFVVQSFSPKCFAILPTVEHAVSNKEAQKGNYFMMCKQTFIHSFSYPLFLWGVSREQQPYEAANTSRSTVIQATCLHKGDKQRNHSANFFIGHRFHATLRVLSPKICKQCIRVNLWKAEKAEQRAEKNKQEQRKQTNSRLKWIY